MTLRALSSASNRASGPRGRGPVAAALTATVLAGCVTVGPDYVAPEPVAADRWHQALVEGLVEGGADLHTWWTAAGDPVLDDLIARAATGNRDLRTAYARVAEARAALGIATGERYPDVNAAGAATRSRAGGAAPSSPVGSTTALALDASWELDLWGRVRRTVEAASASYEASVEDARDVTVVLLAEVGRNYVDLRTVDRRLALAEANVELQRETLELVKVRNRAELAPDLEVRQAELNLATTESVLPTLRLARARAINRISVLLGETPGPLRAELQPAASPPVLLAAANAGIPADALRRRPDVRRAERLLAAQTARVGVATAALYPNFFLAGDIGYLAAGGALVDSDNEAWSIGPSMLWNLFDGGRVRGLIAVEDARTAQVLATYEQTVFRALEETENALVAVVEERQRVAALERSVVAAQEADRLARSLYKSGLTNFQTVLDSQRSLFTQQDLLADSVGRVNQNTVALYRALGGGWRVDAP